MRGKKRRDEKDGREREEEKRTEEKEEGIEE